MKIMGLDLSLTATGVATVDGVTYVLDVGRRKGMQRMAHISSEVADLAAEADLVVLEGYAFSAHSAHAHEIGALGGIVRYDLWRMGSPIVEVGPSSLKKFTTGKGNARKDAMLAAAIRQWGFEGSDNNEADAWMLRCMAIAHYAPFSALPAFAHEALKKIAWPDREELRSP